jgi:hypothetical protein
MIRSRSIHKSRRLLTVDNFIKIAIQKSILDIELMYGPRARDTNVEH